MRSVIGIILALVCFEAMANPGFGGRGDERGRFGREDRRPGHGGRIETISVRYQSYFPDQLTATAVCRVNGHRDAANFTSFRQAGNRIDGNRSFDGRNFAPQTWGGGMALDLVACNANNEPVAISVRYQSYFPDHLTAAAVCRANGRREAVSFTSFRQAGNRIDGNRSFDGRNFAPHTWGGGMALDVAFCR